MQVMRTGKLGTLHPIMPWVVTAGMKDEDLKAMFACLRSLRPVKLMVTNGQPPTDCPVCGLKHGGGERNGV